MQDTPDYESPKEFAARWGVHPSTVHRLIRAGTIPAVKLGPRLTRIDPEKADTAMQEQSRA